MPTDSKPLQGLSDRYEVLDLLGEGGMGRVYKAQDLTLNRTVAIKVLFGQFAEMNVPRFQREAQTMSALKHENLVDVYDFGITNSGDAFLVMEYVTGVTMSSIVKKRAPMNVLDVIELCRGIASGMAHAHSKNVVHRDLKPSNILVRNEQDLTGLKILDFGISKALDSGKDRDFLTMTGQMIGTPLYMSPEQAQGAQVDQRADIYSLGCIMYECLSGKVPFRGDTALDTVNLHRFAAPQSLIEKRPDVPSRLNALVLRLLAKTPEERVQTMQQVSDELDAIAQDLVSLGALPKPGREEVLEKVAPLAPNQSHKMLLIVAAFLGILVLSVIGFGTWRATTTIAGQGEHVEGADSWEKHFELKGDGVFSDRIPADSALPTKGGALTGAQAQLLQAAPPVIELRIEHSRMQPDFFTELAKLPELKSILLKDPPNVDLKQVASVTNLQNLYLRDPVRVSRSDVQSWNVLKKLRRLHFDKVDIADDAISEIARSVPWLELLEFSNCMDFNGTSLVDLARMKKLTYLSLANQQIPDSKLNALMNSRSIDHILFDGNRQVTLDFIKRLLLHNTQITHVGVGKCTPEVRTGVTKLHIRNIQYSGLDEVGGPLTDIVKPDKKKQLDDLSDTFFGE